MGVVTIKGYFIGLGGIFQRFSDCRFYIVIGDRLALVLALLRTVLTSTIGK